MENSSHSGIEREISPELAAESEFVWVANTADANIEPSDPTTARPLTKLEQLRSDYGVENVKVGEALNPKTREPSIVPKLRGLYVRRSVYLQTPPEVVE